MNEEICKLLTLRHLPGMLNSEQAASLLGVEPHDVPVLVRAGLLKPLGNPLPSAVKHYATFQIEQNCRDEKWLHKARRAW